MSRVSVPLAQAYRLTNHGPTILISAAHDNQRNLMAAAWNMPLDFDPPKIAVVIDKRTYTRELIEAAGSFAINVPCRAQAEMVMQVGAVDGNCWGKRRITSWQHLTFRRPPPEIL